MESCAAITSSIVPVEGLLMRMHSWKHLKYTVQAQALDVFEIRPVPANAPLIQHETSTVLHT